MSDGDATSPHVSALVEALDARARQAGSEGAAGLVRGALGTLSETLTELERRLAGLEEAFLRAIDDSNSGTQAVVDQIRDAVVAQLPAPAPPPEPPEPPDVRGAVADALTPVLARLSQLEARVGALVDAPAPEPVEPVDPALLRRLDEAVDTMRRDEGSARLVGLVEERMNAMIRVVDDRLASLESSVSTTAGDVRVATDAAVGRLTAALDERLRRLDELDARPAVRALQEQIAKLRDDDRVLDAVRREAELLTQRVAALAVGVEATRVMCEQIATATEQSLGRRAGEMGRRLAKDLGLAARRSPVARRDRELGRGES